MSVKISRTTSTTATSSSRSSKSSTGNKSSSSSSKSSNSKSSSSLTSSSKPSTSKSSGASKSSTKTTSSKTLGASKGVLVEISSKASNPAKTSRKVTGGKTSSSSSCKSTSQNTNKISSSTKNITSSSKNTISNLKSNVNSSIIGAISGTKYIMDAPAIYTKQALKSTVGSSATALAKNPPKDYVPGMPSTDYEKYKKSLEPKFNGKTTAINKMLNNIDKDKSLKLSDDKKTAMLVAGEKLLNKGYEAKFVAGVLGNIISEGTPGLFESSCYSNLDKKPAYLKCMQDDFQYDTKYSGKTIGQVGIKETVKLQKQASTKQHTMMINGKKKLVKDQFGFGMCQFTGSRTGEVLEAYKDYYDKTNDNHPTQAKCAEIEANFMVKELEGSFKEIYKKWKKGDKTVSNAGELICLEYERPYDKKNQASIRADNATAVYNIMKIKNQTNRLI